ncbi:hypothetical protein HYH03_017986 [Edaphochlamys debaryana]|uniref:Uncharacterized protein n=1 Tax=Edaphochlamys debaryana TaxID=47281 RepID=A0A835XLC2_9CHLO|nr:hypothetical protein HYH03_017986 [Edaphochlamys debaryana]|eukprot:KAG2483140.1 hypothetical protein HYH03_017986 [Edaphochlamys debaryana]
MKGRWVFNQWPAPEAQDLAVLCLNYATDPATKQRECALNQPNKMYNLPYRKTSLRWLPDGCRPPPPATLVERKPCMRKWLANGKKVCTLGDSHLRYLSRALKYWSESDVGAEFPAYGLDPLDNLKHEDLHMEQVSYYVELWGTLPAEQIQGKLAQCSVVFTSFGSWQMALNASISNYVEQLAAYTQVLARLAQTGVHVVWVGIPAHGFNVARTKPGCTDLRLAPVVATYDRLAYEMVHKYRIPFIDWWEPTVSLLEASQDSAHFSWNSPPGGLLLDKVVQSLCAHTDAHASRYLRI